jgi:fatty acid desaturase
VHHLNPRVPNNNLEAARCAIPEIASIKPLSWEQIKRCSTHLFWDEKDRVMTPFFS